MSLKNPRSNGAIYMEEVTNGLKFRSYKPDGEIPETVYGEFRSNAYEGDHGEWTADVQYTGEDAQLPVSLWELGIVCSADGSQEWSSRLTVPDSD